VLPGLGTWGLEGKLPSGILLTTVEKVAGYAHKSSVWPASFGLACCAIELFQAGALAHRHEIIVASCGNGHR
jgi:NADH:ubiquinone oxidoreductase subunit B-like Fe-S oxidoreductase